MPIKGGKMMEYSDKGIKGFTHPVSAVPGGTHSPMGGLKTGSNSYGKTGGGDSDKGTRRPKKRGMSY